MNEAFNKVKHRRMTRMEGDPRRACEVGKENARQDPSSVCNFYGRDFFVTKDVLTPRPETEQIIDEVLKLCGKPILPGVKPEKPKLNPNNLTILDVGTGSGCIAITLSLELPGATVYASDISDKALRIAQKNASNLNASIHTIISYLLKNVNITPDIIVANLPYVDKAWDWLDQESLKDDPDIALYTEGGGLKLIKELIDTATSKYLILECDPCQHDGVIKYAKKKYEIININGYVLSLKRTKNNISTNHIKFPI